MSKQKPIMLRDQKAIELIHKRAKSENRSFSNALAQTVIENLSPEHKQHMYDTHFGILPQKQ